MSGSRWGVSGVGTQMIRTSGSPSRRKSADAARRPADERLGQATPVQMLDVVAAGAEGLDLGRIDVETEDREALFGEGQGQRQPDVPEADDAHERGPPLDPLSEG